MQPRCARRALPQPAGRLFAAPHCEGTTPRINRQWLACPVDRHPRRRAPGETAFAVDTL